MQNNTQLFFHLFLGERHTKIGRSHVPLNLLVNLAIEKAACFNHLSEYTVIYIFI